MHQTSAPASRAAYHHGNLRAALITAGLELTRSGGSAALVLREVTRRVGVSPNAAYRHFADRDRLLAAVSATIQADMVAQMESSRTGIEGPRPDSARDRLRAVGLGYIGFALAEPGWFEVAFPGPTREEVGDSGTPAPLAMLVAALDGLVEAGLISPSARVGAEWPSWSAVHGFAALALYGPLRNQPRPVVDAAAARTVDAIITGLLAT